MFPDMMTVICDQSSCFVLSEITKTRHGTSVSVCFLSLVFNKQILRVVLEYMQTTLINNILNFSSVQNQEVLS